jgi:DNA repair exonuclease SbcCD nuclease subunit
MAGELALSPERRAARERELRAIPAAIATLANAEAVDVVLAPGDLIDVDGADAASVQLLVDAVAAMAPIPVVVCAGNHDPLLPVGPYAAPLRAARGEPPWPSNLHVLTEGAPYRLPERPGVAFLGIPHRTTQPVAERVLASQVERPSGGITVLLLHGSLVDNAPEGKVVTHPFTARELIAQGFTYAALGHHHVYNVIEAGTGRIRGAYAGRPAGMSWDAQGVTGVLAGEIDGDVVTLERRVLDRRRLHEVVVDVGRVTSADAVWERVRAACAVASADDIVAVRVIGTAAPEVNLTPPVDLSPAALSERFFHAEIDTSRVERERVHATDPRSIEGRFATKLARLAGSQNTPPDVRREALLCGLRALEVSAGATNARSAAEQSGEADT